MNVTHYVSTVLLKTATMSKNSFLWGKNSTWVSYA